MGQGRIYVFETSEKICLKLKRWSIAKFYTLFERLEEIAELVSEAVSEYMPKGGNNDAEYVAALVRIALKIATSTHGKFNFIIQESLFDPPKDFDPEDLLPEDYLGLLASIVEQNITERTLKNLKRLLTAFNRASQQTIS